MYLHFLLFFDKIKAKGDVDMAIRTIKQYNLNDIMDTDLEGKWEMPIIYKDDIIPRDLIGFNYAKTSKSKDLGIHFYIDDYQFERIWVEPSKYVDMLSKYECILSPDFSLYLDMPLPMKIWNTYRGRYIGQYYQKRGIKCVPTLSWGDEDTFDFAFEGIEKNSIISVSTLGVMKSNQAKDLWQKGMAECIRRIEPSNILIYGNEIDYNFGNIKVKYYKNKNVERLEERR